MFGKTDYSKEELRKFKEGEVIEGKDGKHYRVKKSILPKESTAGPHGIGEPEDRSLRKIEANVLIPNIMNRQIESKECRPQYEDLVGCLRTEGAVTGLRTCKNVLGVFNECKSKMFNDSEFRQKVTNEYLHDRSEARRTGLAPKARMLQEYRDWKKQNEQS